MLFSLLIGSCAGSFICLVIERGYQHKSILRPRSHCPACQQPLSFWELIPIFSILRQKFRCRHCNASVPKIYLFAEISGVLLFLILSQLPAHFSSSLYLIWFFSGWLLSLTDLFFYHVEPKILYPATALMLLIAWLNQFPIYWQQTAFLFLIFLCVQLFLPTKIGGGDLQLLLCWSLFLTERQLALLICFASLLGIFVILFSTFRLKPIKKLPFIPFLWAALLLILLPLWV